MWVVFVFAESVKDHFAVFCYRRLCNFKYLRRNIGFACADNVLCNLTVEGDVELVHDSVLHHGNAFADTELFRPALAVGGFLIVDVHDVERSVAYVRKHIYARHFMEPVDNRCISLRIDRTAHNPDTIQPVIEDEFCFLVLGKITAETLALFLYPSKWKSCCDMYVRTKQTKAVKLTGDAVESKNVVVTVIVLICDKGLVYVAYLIIGAAVEENVSLKSRLAVISSYTRECGGVRRLMLTSLDNLRKKYLETVLPEWNGSRCFPWF